MRSFGPGTLGGSRASLPGLVLTALVSVLFSFGCGHVSGETASGSRKASPKFGAGIKVCQVQVSLLEKAVRQTKWYRLSRLKLAQVRGRAQKILDGMTAKYKERYALDIRAARHLKKEEELDRLRGSVISEDEYKSRREKLQALLDADPGLKRAVQEQRSNSMAYRVRKQNALMEATRIALTGRKLERQLAEVAGDLDEHLHDVLRAAIRSVAARALAAKRCDLVCAGATVVGARRPRRGSCKMRAEVDLTGQVARFAVQALGGRPVGKKRPSGQAARPAPRNQVGRKSGRVSKP